MGLFHGGVGWLVLLLVAGCGPIPPTPTETPMAPAPARPADVHANELGLIPVLMYHRLVAQPRSVYDRTPDDFRAELERLAREGYVPITTAEMAGASTSRPVRTPSCEVLVALAPDGEGGIVR